MKRNQICKALQKGRQELTRRVVHEVAVGVELLGRASDENLRLQERSGAASTSPAAPTPSLSWVGSGIVETSARNGSALPFNGDLHATEAVDGNLHHLVGTGLGSTLGRFTYTAEITVDETTGNGMGTVVWTAASGDKVLASTLRIHR